ncbi:MAG: ROK family transcriptional regulator [Jatrophihabitans sp.]|uniref:ROK family transcriptional regulator n=1 Tax=Jatrophihabitans sp. TaxID=1932789 RepID=UPI0039165F7B
MTSLQARHWRSAADALALLRQQAVVTRPQLGRRLGLESGPTSDLVKRVARAGLICERPAPTGGRGRPTTTVHAHPSGPLALVVDLRHGDWRLGTCALDGEVNVLAVESHDGTQPGAVVARIRSRLRSAARRVGDRLIGVGVAVPGPTVEDRFANVTMLGWRDLDLGRLSIPELPLVVANDATMAAVAEARLHTPQPRSLLHLVVEIGIGGALVIDGRPVASARGVHGEFGHLPLGPYDETCPCGARGCWTIPFDPPHIARRTGLRLRPDPRTQLHRLFTDECPSEAARGVRQELATSLGRGTAGLVNALDPDLVTLGGLAFELRAAVPDGFDDAVRSGLMDVHRHPGPRIVEARSGDDAPLVGAGLSVLDRVVDAAMLAEWAAKRATA